MTHFTIIELGLGFLIGYTVVRDIMRGMFNLEHPDPAVREYLKKRGL